jgi:hypothetical protein
MPTHLGFTVWMEVDGTKLEEYKIEQDESNSTVTCWVPCQSGKVRRIGSLDTFGNSWSSSGKEFRIGLQAPDPPRERNYTLAFKMDGRRVELIRRKMVRMEDPDVEPRYYESTSVSMMRSPGS